MTSTTTTAPAMKAARIHHFMQGFGLKEVQAGLTMQEISRPHLAKTKNSILIKVLACSLSPGDLHMASGNIVFLHPKTFPYTVGMDVCGRVEAFSDDVKGFSIGDVVVAANGMEPQGGMAEYMVVQASEAVLKPKSVSIEEAAASSSSITALDAVGDQVKGKRVLILGGSGGVGSAAIQLAKLAGASYVATTSSQVELCESLGADFVINYRKEDWWTHKTFVDNKLDVIIDTVGGNQHWLKSHSVLKTRRDGGQFVAVCGDNPKPDMGTVWKALRFMLGLPWRPLATKLSPGKYPSYQLLFPEDTQKGRKQVMKKLDDSSIMKVVIDSIHPFTEAGVREAFVKVASGHAHGKVVVKMT